MPYMMEAGRQDHVVPIQNDLEMPAEPMAMRYQIRRAGGRPLSFSGTELGMAMSYTPGIPYWYEINLFQAGEGFVLAIKRFHQSEDEGDLSRAWRFDTLDAAVDHLETYDAGDDVPLPAMPGPEAAAGDLAVLAASLRARIEDARGHFAGLVGEFLYELDEA